MQRDENYSLTPTLDYVRKKLREADEMLQMLTESDEAMREQGRQEERQKRKETYWADTITEEAGK